MSPLVRLMRDLASGGFHLQAEGSSLVVTGNRLTEEQANRVREFKDDLMELVTLHGDNLLRLFSDPPPWPAARGRDGMPVDARGFIRIIGAPLAFHGGTGTLRAVLYDTRTGRLRLRVALGDWRGLLLDPEDLEEQQPTPGGGDAVTLQLAAPGRPSGGVAGLDRR